MASAGIGRSVDHTSRAGRSIISKDHQLNPTVCMPLNPAVGSGKSSNARMTGGRRGRQLATSSSMTGFPAPINGTTARNILGNSNASGTWNRRSAIQIRSLPGWRMRRCSGRRTAARRGRSFRAARCQEATSGSRVPAGCACTRSCWIRAIPTACLSPSRPRAHSGPMTRGKTWRPINHGLQSAIHSGSRRRSGPLRAPHRHAPARGRMCSSCRSTGT